MTFCQTMWRCIIKPRKKLILKESEEKEGVERDGELALVVYRSGVDGRVSLCVLAGARRCHIHRFWRGVDQGGFSEGMSIIAGRKSSSSRAVIV